ncbi:expressed unknown protein [Seminavis robusta]|uniref:Uncharacterized protein n=1 Tax=Seminavis robusta TaxID=568900 RepID=A0A9N8HER0_9STRA|nr:expressed unknown protein [Seminavis robusta]|eukprot:Sro421_g139450.1 n/a (444) ;mRNA; r:10709-12040
MPFSVAMKRHWLQMPCLLFLGLLLFEYGLEANYSERGERSDLLLDDQLPDTEPFLEVPLWEDLGLEYCRFPDFYDESRHRYSLGQEEHWVESGWKHREELKTASYNFDPSKIKDNTNEYYQMLLRTQQPRFNFTSLKIQRNISFLHLGKAGGSSIGCHLAESRRYVRKHCDPALMRRPVPMSPLSLHVNCFNHMSGHQYCLDINDSFLVNARHPIDRIASWYLYEHPLNHQVNYAERDYHCGDLMLFSCYPTFDALVSNGLAGSPPPNLKEQPLRMQSNLTQSQCAQWAWAAVQGHIPSTYHNFYNYDWYTHRLFNMEEEDDSDAKTAPSKEIFVIRAEHMVHDWKTINRLLGGPDTQYSWPESLGTPQNSAQQKVLPVSTTNASSFGIQNLCRALCLEILTYKRLLSEAVNLGAADLKLSLEELGEVCPDEAAFVTRQQCRR